MRDEPHRGLLAGLVEPFADEAVAQSRRPPHAQRQSLTGYGAFFLSWCWVLLDIWGPLAATAPAPMFHYGWWICAALGVICLIAGLFGRARGPLVGGIGLCLEAGGSGWLLWNDMYPADMPLAAFLLHGVYFSILTSALAQLASGIIAWQSSDAERVVRRNMAAKNPPIIPVRR